MAVGFDVRPWNLATTLMLGIGCGAPAAGTTADDGGESESSGSASESSATSSSSTGVPECRDEDCSGDAYCRNNYCYYPCADLPGELDVRCPGEPECFRDEDCYEGSQCQNYNCVPQPDDPVCPNPWMFTQTLSIPFEGEGQIGSLAFVDVLPTPGAELVGHRGGAVVVANATSSTVLVETDLPLVGATAGDVDGDGSIDLVTQKTTDERGVVLLQTWLGEAESFTEVLPGSFAFAGSSLAVGDHDGDGFGDAFFIAGEGVYSLAGNASGGWGEDVKLVDSGADYLVLADFDEDDLVDVAYAGFGSAGVLLSSVGTPSALGGYSFVSPRAIAAADFDADLALDLALVATNDPALATWRGPLGETSNVVTPVSADPTLTTAGDLDADGRADLIVVHDGGPLAVHFGGSDRDSLFRCAHEYEPPHAIRSLAIGDIDGDGDADLVVTDGEQVTALAP